MLKFSVFCDKRPFSRKKGEQGFSLLEMIITIALLGVVYVIVSGGLMGSKGEAERAMTKVALSRISGTLVTYKLKHHRFPSTEEGLAALVKARLAKKKELKDSFGNELSYEFNGKGYVITSPGPDGEEGTEDDIVFDSESDEEDEE